MATAKQIKKAMAKKQGFSGNPRVELLHFPDKVSQEAIDLYCKHYHADKIPDKYFKKPGHYFILLETIYYTDKRGRKHPAKAGLISDGISNPRFTWVTFGAPIKSPYLPPALVHDYDCQHARDIPDKYLRAQYRHDSDILLKEMALFVKPNRKFKAWRMFKGVRLGAWWEEVER